MINLLSCGAPYQEQRSVWLWISGDTWRIVDKRVFTRRDPRQYQLRLRKLGRGIQASLNEDRQQQVTMAVEAVESLLTGTLLSHSKLRGGYGGGTEKRWIMPCHPLKSHSNGSRQSARSYTSWSPPPGKTIPTSVPPSPIDNSLPTEE